MNKHVPFDELQKFVYADKLTPEIIKLGAKINSHVLVCSECAEQYDALLELQGRIECLSQSANIAETQQPSLQEQRDMIEAQMSDTHEAKEQPRSKVRSNDSEITRQ